MKRHVFFPFLRPSTHTLLLQTYARLQSLGHKPRCPRGTKVGEEEHAARHAGIYSVIGTSSHQASSTQLKTLRHVPRTTNPNAREEAWTSLNPLREAINHTSS